MWTEPGEVVVRNEAMESTGTTQNTQLHTFIHEPSLDICHPETRVKTSWCFRNDCQKFKKYRETSERLYFIKITSPGSSYECRIIRNYSYM